MILLDMKSKYKSYVDESIKRLKVDKVTHQEYNRDITSNKFIKSPKICLTLIF